MNQTDIEDYISVRTRMLMNVFGKKESDELVRVFKESLARFPLFALKAAFHRAEQNLDRFPTPKTMIGICGEQLPSQGWRFNHKDVQATDPETGEPITAKRDAETGELLYRATQCPEGRAFLERLRSYTKRPA